MYSREFTRRKFASRFASLLSVFGVGAVISPSPALAESSAAVDRSGIRKLNGEGKPGEKEIIMPVIVHNGWSYVSGQGAHDKRDPKEWTIESHTTVVMDKIKQLVEVGGRTTDSSVQL